MPLTTCPSEQQLLDFQLGNLPEPALDAVADHLEHCERCETLAQKLDTELDPILAPMRDRTSMIVNDTSATRAMRPGSDEAAASAEYSFLRPPRQADEIGRLGNYRVLRLLGKGGMGFVFHAEDRALCRPVALKVMKPDMPKDTNGWQRFLREARIMASIKDDHLVTVFQAGQEENLVYLAMELLAGESLADRIDRAAPVPLAEVVRLGCAIAGGLAVIHRHGLVHRDIKPDNIWLEAPAGRVKILDFGLARFLEDDVQITQTGTVMGTPSYMSPEQARGDVVDGRSDLFSLGCVLYVLCTGREAFSARSTMAVLTALAVDTPQPVHELNPALPRALSDLIMQLLAKKPLARPVSAEVVIQRLQQLDGVQAGPPPLPASEASTRLMIPESGPKRTPLEGKRGMSIAAAVGLVAVLAVVAMVKGMRRPADPSAPAKVEDVRPALPEQRTYLKSLVESGNENWWFVPPHAPEDEDRPPRGPKEALVRFRGTTYRNGIFMHPPPRPPEELRGKTIPVSISYRLGKQYKSFRARVSLNDGVEKIIETTMTFTVYGDGKELWRSRPVWSQEQTQDVQVSIDDVDELKIEVICTRGPVRGAHAIWIDPVVVK